MEEFRIPTSPVVMFVLHNLKNSAHIPQTEIMDVLEITNAHLAFQNSKFLVF